MRALAVVAAVAVAMAAAGCGGSDSGSRTLTVSAASSLKAPFGRYGDSFGAADVRLSFAGSDELAAQIRKGIRPDVFAAASTDLPDALHRDGLVDKPVVFAANRLVVAVPAGSRVRSLGDLAQPGTKLAIGSASVPVGKYTRAVLGRLGGDTGEAILANVRSNEPDVGGVVGKLSQGAVDAGFVYVTDAVATDGRLKAIELPRELRPGVAYAVAVVKGARNPAAARAWIDGLVRADGAGARVLREEGFERPR